MSRSTWPSVTAVVATRDRPQLLVRAVQAILDQSYEGDLECLVVFDQSDPHDIPVHVPDGRRLRVIRNERTPGLPGGRNSGILNCDADLVAFCDDDDEWLPGKLAAQVALLDRHPDASAVSTGILVHFEEKDRARLAPAETLGYEDFLRSRIVEVHPSTILIPRRLLVGPVGLVDEEIPGGYNEDYEWLLRAARVGPVVNVLAPLTRVYWHSSSFFFDRWRTIVSAIEYLLAKHPDIARDPQGLARLQGQMAFAHAGMGDGPRARALAGQALRSNHFDKRAIVALIASTGLVRAGTISKVAHHFGRGI